MKTNLLKLLSCLAIALGTSSQLSAQAQLIVTLNNNNSETFDFTEIRSLKFGLETMNLHKNNGSVSTWSISEIANYRFEGVSGLGEMESTAGKLEVFPNPAHIQAVISFYSAQNQKITIEVLDVLGRKVSDIYSGNHVGQHSYSWQVNIPKGTYICRVIAAKGIVTKSLIIQ